MAIDACVENFFGVSQKLWQCRPRGDSLPSIPAGIQDKISLKNQLRRQWKVTRDLAL
jgi:hypothetical protein